MVNNCVEKHYAVIADRGGAKRIHTLRRVSSVQWNRVVDDMSIAQIEIAGEACRDQASILGQIEPRRHELVIYRGQERVWEGPIVAVSWGLDRVRISAKDVLEYLDGRAISKYWPGPDDGGPPLMGDRIEEIIEYELSTDYDAPGANPPEIVSAWENIDPPINVLPHLDVRAGSVLTRTDTFPFEMSVYEHLSNLAEGGLDFTTIGRKVLIWDSALTIGETRTMTSGDFSGAIEIYAAGQDFVGVQHVVASRDGEGDELPPTSTENVGSAIRDVDYYGPWARVHSRSEEDAEVTQETLRTQALRLSAGKNPVPTDIIVGSSAQIRLDNLLSVNALVAGVDVPVIANLAGRKINQMQRFHQITVNETSTGEVINATLIPGKGEIHG